MSCTPVMVAALLGVLYVVCEGEMRIYRRARRGEVERRTWRIRGMRIWKRGGWWDVGVVVRGETGDWNWWLFRFRRGHIRGVVDGYLYVADAHLEAWIRLDAADRILAQEVFG